MRIALPLLLAVACSAAALPAHAQDCHDAQAAAARVQAGRADDARTQLAVHGATTRCD